MCLFDLLFVWVHVSTVDDGRVMTVHCVAESSVAVGIWVVALAFAWVVSAFVHNDQMPRGISMTHMRRCTIDRAT